MQPDCDLCSICREKGVAVCVCGKDLRAPAMTGVTTRLQEIPETHGWALRWWKAFRSASGRQHGGQMKTVWQAEQIIWSDDTWYEDGGRALVINVVGDDQRDEGEGLFVRLQSWAEDPRSSAHDLARSLVGSKIRVTIEVADSWSER